MIYVFAFWGLISLLFIATGMLGEAALSKLTSPKPSSIPQNAELKPAFSGIIGITIWACLANWLSLWLPLGKLSYFLFLAVLFISGWAFLLAKRSKFSFISPCFTPLSCIAFALIFFTVLIKSASPSEIGDEGGYYLPYIKWIESFPTVPGLANLQGRFGYNSIWHSTAALFSFRELISNPFYELNGLVIILFAWHSIFETAEEKPYLRAVYLLLPALLFRSFITSSAADTPTIFVSYLFVLSMWKLISTPQTPDWEVKFSLSCLLFGFLVTTKTSNAILVFLFAPAFAIIFRQYSKANVVRILAILSSIAVLFIVPWIVRFYVSTGFLIFPIHQIDLFNPDWKVSSGTIMDESYAVTGFARNEHIPVDRAATQTLLEWVPGWIARAGAKGLSFIALILSGTIATALMAKRSILTRLETILLVSVMLAIVIWFYKFPAFRFGFGFILPYVLLTHSKLFFTFTKRKDIFLKVALLTLALFSAVSFMRSSFGNSVSVSEILVRQAPFPSVDLESLKVGGMDFYRGQLLWDSPLPGILPWKKLDFSPRGTALIDGFRFESH